MERFSDRSILVTGGAHGIGRAAVRRLVGEGASVMIADIDLAPAMEVARDLGNKVHVVECDITDDESVQRAVEAAVETFGSLDALVHTAGGDRVEPPFEHAGSALWHELLDFNLVGTVRCIRAALPHLTRSSFGGNAVIIGSVNAEIALGSYPYSSAKAGLPILVMNLAREFGPEGIRFNLIEPATVRTRVWDDQAASLEYLKTLYPLKRVGEPEDIAAAICFLASDDASWITGVSLRVDGGFSAGSFFTPPPL